MPKPAKRILILMTAVFLLLTFCATEVLRIAVWNDSLAKTAVMQQTLTLTFTSGRGSIYDRNLQPLTGGKTSYLAAVVPGKETAAALSKVLTAQQMSSVYDRLKAGAPFLTKLDALVETDGILCFPEQERYPEQMPAAHLIGYLDSGGCGISGVEKAFNSLLTAGSKTTKITYQVDALRHLLPGESPQVLSSVSGAAAGVVLTIDKDLQKIVEDSAAPVLKKGAVVVLEAGTGRILASASFPNYDPTDITKALKSDDGALVNRVLQPYSVGSVFKLAAAAAALEHGANPNAKYTCTGSETVEGLTFHCAGGEAHGTETMCSALANSCNCYFIKLMQAVPQAQFLTMARSLGFGQSTEIAPGLSGSAGTLPALSELANRRALANFSIGQGTLLATPLQIAAMVNAVASQGIYTQPTVYAGQADGTGHLSVQASLQKGVPVFSHRSAQLLCSFMQESMASGTSRPGRPVHVKAAAKTGTAQTGHFTDGKEELICWYTGFFPVDTPKYVVTVLSEGGESGGKTCGPVFQKIADALYPHEIDNTEDCVYNNPIKNVKKQ